MKKIMTMGVAAALFVSLALVPGTALARKGHHVCPKSSRVDRNHDGLPDKWECKHNLSLRVNQARHDQDRDGLNNRGEFEAGDNPRDADTDNDGVRDGQEHAGTIAGPVASNGDLTINLDGGGVVTAKVVAGVTRIKCENENEHTTAQASRNGADDNSGPGSANSGSGDRNQGADDRGDRAGENEQGDDRGDDNRRNDNANCTAADLTTGRSVREAEIEVTSSGPVFEKIELG
jgi:hypothetical protein